MRFCTFDTSITETFAPQSHFRGKFDCKFLRRQNHSLIIPNCWKDNELQSSILLMKIFLDSD